MWLKHWLLLAAAVLVGLAHASLTLAGASSEEVQETGWLASHDLVGEGSLVALDNLLVRPLQKCERGYADSLEGIVATIKVSRLLVGTLSDSTVQVIRRDRGFPGQEHGWIGMPGDRVFFRAMRYCEYLWRPIGDVLLISPGDTLESGDWPSVAVLPLLREPLHGVRARLDGARQHQGLAPFDGARDVVLVRLEEYSQGEASDPFIRSFRYRCTGLARLFGSDVSYPDSLGFVLQSGCFPFTGPGDTLVVPVPAGFRGGELSVRACSRQWKVENSFLPGFGVPLAELKQKVAFVSGATKLQRIGVVDAPE